MTDNNNITPDPRIGRHIISDSVHIIDALRRLNELSGKTMTLFVTDSRGKMVGTLTDGDIRRGLLNGATTGSSVRDVMHRDFKWLDADCPDPETLRRFRLSGMRLIPLLDREGCLVRVIDTADTLSLLPLSAILMAGGKGERLRPLTVTTPKPLLRVGDRPIIDYNIRSLLRAGIEDIYVTVNYLADQIREHFTESCPAVKCVDEPFAMGTIGAAALIELPEQGDTVVMNADLLTTISLEDMYLHHRSCGADLTIAAIPYNVAVPYAILTTEGDRVTALEEKPSYSYYANAGIYIISNKLLGQLPEDARTDATDLISDAIGHGYKVSYWPVSGLWLDIGTPADYAHACELMANHQALG